LLCLQFIEHDGINYSAEERLWHSYSADQMRNAQASFNRLFEVMDDLVDDRIGIVRWLGELPKQAGEPDFFHFYAEACNTKAFSGQGNFRNTGGASGDRATAMAKAVGEAVERYCPALFVQEQLPLARFSSAPFPCIRPDQFALYSQEQLSDPTFPHVRFDADTLVRWAKTSDVATGETWYVPAAMVYMPYYFNRDHGEESIAPRISTGLACHCSPAEAALSAICEVIERDAITILWQAKLGMPKIRIESLSKRNRDLVARFECCGHSVIILNITLDHHVPTILSVLRSCWPGMPALVFAASSHPCSEVAIRKSLEELAHTRRLAQELKTQKPSFRPAMNYHNVIDQETHVHLYCDQASLRLAEFIFASGQEMDFEELETFATGDPVGDVQSVVEQISNIGHQVLLADITTSDVADLGLIVMRAVIPGFHPLFIGHKLRALGGFRLWGVPQKLGYVGITRATGDNLAPHPFP
jgi:ribosomal protein S12 methylthiotransferase accessory factor